MIERARQRGIYDQLWTEEITRWLAVNGDRQFDVIAACDTLIYFGDLRQVVPLAAERLRPEGVLVFTVERADACPFHLTDSGRYAHDTSHILDVVAETGLAVHRLDETVIRYEYGEPVVGLVAVLSQS